MDIQKFCSDDETIDPLCNADVGIDFGEDLSDSSDEENQNCNEGSTDLRIESMISRTKELTQQVEQLKIRNEELTKQIEEMKSANEKLEEISSSIKQLTSQVLKTNNSISMHETIEDNLNKELQQYKNDFYSSLSVPFLQQFISLHKEMEKEMQGCIKDNSDGHLDEAVDILDYYLKKIEGSLINCGVEARHPESGEKYDPLTQIIVNIIETDDQGKNEIIESAKSNSYIYNGKTLAPAKVAVYKKK